METQSFIEQLNKKDQEKAEELFTKNIASEIYERTSDEMVEPGYYSVIETDQGGIYDMEKFNIQITKPINLKELALKLYDDLNYKSSWHYLNIQPARIETKITY